MTDPLRQWQQICTDYLAAVRKALSGAPAGETRQILEDITVHLDERYHELAPDERTWENFQHIITDMGPVEDYAALLESQKQPKSPRPNRTVPILIGVCVGLIGIFAIAGGVNLLTHIISKSDPIAQRPVVIETSPKSLSTNVSPETTEISVTFDRPMMNLSWSWVGGDLYPETTGQPRYNKERTTCTLPVKLQPGRFYWIGINSEKFTYFQTEQLIAARPYAILFATTDENGNPTEIPENYTEEAIRINSQ